MAPGAEMMPKSRPGAWDLKSCGAATTASCCLLQWSLVGLLSVFHSFGNVSLK